MTAARTPTEQQLEAMALGELDPGSFGLLVDDPRLVALRESDRDIRARYPARAVALRVQRRVAESRRRTTLWLTSLLAPAAVAGAVLIAVTRPTEPALLEPPDVTVVKGLAPDVIVYALRDGAPTAINRASAGERVQLAVIGAGDAHGVVLSIDGRGNVTRHFPSEATGSTLLAAQGDGHGEVQLPDGFELDDAPDFERFFVVTSASALDVGAIEQAVRHLPAAGRKAATLVLPTGLHQGSRVIEKTAGNGRSP